MRVPGTPQRPAVDARDDRGSILPLIAGYGALALVVVLLVTAATSLYLERKRLFTLADGAALVGAESFDLSAVRVTSVGVLRPLLTDDAVRRDASAYLSQAPTADLDALQLVSATTPDGLSARITLASYWRPPVLTLFVPEGLRLEVTATGRSVFG